MTPARRPTFAALALCLVALSGAACRHRSSDGGGGCRQDGAACVAASECCSGSCPSGFCGAALVCKSDGALCSAATECCSGQCTQTNGGQHVCGAAPTCAANGTACSVPADCCSQSCTGTCVDPNQCKAVSQACGSDANCCTNSCVNGVCVEPVMGAEGEGMRRLTREHCDELVRIPMSGRVESLNVSVASGVCLGESFRQRRQSAPPHT